MKNEKTPVPGQGFVNRLSPKMIAFLYALIGAVWIITSDTIVHMIGRNPDIITQLQTYKGWFYVAMTALMLYFLIRLYGNRLMTAMATLRESEERNRLLVESITDYEIYMLDTDGRITAWNLGAQGSKGYRRDEVIGRLHSLFYRNEDIERGVPAQELRQAAERGKIEREGWRARRDGSLFWAETVMNAVRDKQGNLRGFSLVLRDITGRKEAEDGLLRALKFAEDRTAELESANRELEAFSNSLAHDLRTPLRSIRAFAEILLEGYAGKRDQKEKEYTEYIKTSSEQLTTLVYDVMKLSEIVRSELRVKAVDLSALAKDITAKLAEADPDRNVQVVIQPGISAPGDSALLQVLLENLLDNAWKFTRGRTGATIEFGTVECGVPPPETTGHRPPGDCSMSAAGGMQQQEDVYFVRDNGVGFNREYAQRIFTPFQRLRKVTEFPGTGIGLASARRIVQRHGGRIWAEAEEGKGAVFFFTLHEPLAPVAESFQ